MQAICLQVCLCQIALMLYTDGCRLGQHHAYRDDTDIKLELRCQLARGGAWIALLFG